MYSDEQISKMRQYMIDNPRISQYQVSQDTGISKARVESMSKQLKDEGYERNSTLTDGQRKEMAQQLWDIHKLGLPRKESNIKKQELADKYGLSSPGSMRQNVRAYIERVSIHKKLADYIASDSREIEEAPALEAEKPPETPTRLLLIRRWEGGFLDAQKA